MIFSEFQVFRMGAPVWSTIPENPDFWWN